MAAEPLRVSRRLNLENVAADQMAVVAEELLEIVPVDRRSAIGPETGGERRGAPEVAPARHVVTTQHAPGPHGRARAQSRFPGRSRAAPPISCGWHTLADSLPRRRPSFADAAGPRASGRSRPDDARP